MLVFSRRGFGKTKRGNISIQNEGAADAIVTAVSRFYRYAIRMAREKWRVALERISWTEEDFGQHLKRKYREDERAVIVLLVARTIFCRLHLTRDMIKEALRKLQGQRIEQTALASILCAARFNCFNK